MSRRPDTASTATVADDLALPKPLAIAHELASTSGLADAERRAVLLDFPVLGLS